MQEQLRQPPPELPEHPGQPPPTRWSLTYLQSIIGNLKGYSLSGIWYILRDYGISYKRGKEHVYSPDPDYQAKRDYARWCVEQALRYYPKVVTLYLDEMSYHRQPTIAPDWSRRGTHYQPLAQRSHRSNTRRRIVAVVDVVSGGVIHKQGSKIGIKQLAAFYPIIRAKYPEANTIYVIQDNWPIHFWPPVESSAKGCGINIVALPSYAPWLNPIEKLWRKLRQEVLHLHRMSDRWEELQQRVSSFLDSFVDGSLSLLRYIGLLSKLLPD